MTSKAMAAALPLLLGALSRNASQGDGASSLHQALANDHDGSILDDIGGFLGSGNTSSGNDILGHVLGGHLACARVDRDGSSGSGQLQSDGPTDSA